MNMCLFYCYFTVLIFAILDALLAHKIFGVAVAMVVQYILQLVLFCKFFISYKQHGELKGFYDSEGNLSRISEPIAEERILAFAKIMLQKVKKDED